MLALIKIVLSCKPRVGNCSLSVFPAEMDTNPMIIIVCPEAANRKLTTLPFPNAKIAINSVMSLLRTRRLVGYPTVFNKSIIPA